MGEMKVIRPAEAVQFGKLPGYRWEFGPGWRTLKVFVESLGDFYRVPGNQAIEFLALATAHRLEATARSLRALAENTRRAREEAASWIGR